MGRRGKSVLRLSILKPKLSVSFPPFPFSEGVGAKAPPAAARWAFAGRPRQQRGQALLRRALAKPAASLTPESFCVGPTERETAGTTATLVEFSDS